MDSLTELEWRRLLSTVPVGRLGFTEGALPVIVPVPFTVIGVDEVVVQASEPVVANVGGGAIVAFQVDDWYSAHGRSWSISAVGPCRLVTDPARIAELDGLGFAGSAPAALTYLAIRLTHVRGHRLDRSSEEVGGVEAVEPTG